MQERLLLARRKELIESGVNRKDLRIKELKQRLIIEDEWKEIEVSGNASTHWLSTSPKEKENEVHLLLYNVRSLVDIHKSVNFANALTDCDHYKIICLTETWLVPEIPDNALFIDSFIVHRNDRPSDDEQLEHGAVLIVIDTQLRHKRLNLDPKFSDNKAIQVDFTDYSCII